MIKNALPSFSGQFSDWHLIKKVLWSFFIKWAWNLKSHRRDSCRVQYSSRGGGDSGRHFVSASRVIYWGTWGPGQYPQRRAFFFFFRGWVAASCTPGQFRAGGEGVVARGCERNKKSNLEEYLGRDLQDLSRDSFSFRPPLTDSTRFLSNISIFVKRHKENLAL